FAASGWEVCDVIIACGGHPWKELIFFISQQINMSLEDNFRLLIEWRGHSLEWLVTSGNNTQLVASFTAPSQENPGFDAGYLGISPPPSIGGVPFFQFGIMSSFPIGHSGWEATLICPSILKNSTWLCIDHSQLLQGDQSYWKAVWRWGESYQNVEAVINQEAREITFQYSKVTLQNFENGW
ncbi:MAG: hypothetical protein ACHQ1H_08675, partial [Nitrososphaerales archaeon]